MTTAARAWRVARLTDIRELDAVVALESASFNRATAREPLERDLRRTDVARIYVLRTADERLAAFCACWLIADELHINTIAVEPACRAQGMATHLMRHVLEEATAAGAGRATLEVRASNTAARRLYEKLGFEIAGVRTAYYSSPDEDALILWRAVGAGPGPAG
ncbi:ribosomal protein S18-alanine N-acetyltransferase [soil metagenome]|nr:ribosomal protein S18-alanine N-acetyltransferase [Acidobacteriota bacterium]